MDEDQPRKQVKHEVGMALDAMSVDELEGRVGLLREEIMRLQQAIGEKSASKTAAEAVFKL